MATFSLVTVFAFAKSSAMPAAPGKRQKHLRYSEFSGNAGAVDYEERENWKLKMACLDLGEEWEEDLKKTFTV